MPYAPSPRYWIGSTRPIIPKPFDHDSGFVQIALDSAESEKPYILIGDAGRGKSSLMALTASKIRDSAGGAISYRTKHTWLDRRVLWAQAHELYQDILAEIDLRRKFVDFDQNYAASGLAASVPCLFIDDVGTEPKTAAAIEALQSLIDARYRAELPTWITTNFDMQAFADRYGTRTMSRMFGTTISYVVDGPDRRLASMGIAQ